MNRGSEILDAGKQRNHVTFPESLFFGIWKSLPFKMPSRESLLLKMSAQPTKRSIVSRGKVLFQEIYLDTRFLLSDPIPTGNAFFY